MQLQWVGLVVLCLYLSGCAVNPGADARIGEPQRGLHWIYEIAGGEVAFQHVGDGWVVDSNGSPREAHIVEIRRSEGGSQRLERLFVSLDWQEVILALVPCGEGGEKTVCAHWFPSETPWFFGASIYWGKTIDDLPREIVRDENGFVKGERGAEVHGQHVRVWSTVSMPSGYGDFLYSSFGWEFEMGVDDVIPLRISGLENLVLKEESYALMPPIAPGCSEVERLFPVGLTESSIPRERDSSFFRLSFTDAWESLGESRTSNHYLVAAEYRNLSTRAVEREVVSRAQWDIDLWSHDGGGRSYTVEKEVYGGLGPASEVRVVSTEYHGPSLENVTEPTTYAYLDDVYRLVGEVTTTIDEILIEPLVEGEQLVWSAIAVPVEGGFFPRSFIVHAHQATLTTWQATENEVLRLYSLCD